MAAQVLPAGPLLFLDAASRTPFVGVLGNGDGGSSGFRWLAAHRAVAGEAATESLFALVETALQTAELALAACAGFVFTEGPGSILGIRVVAAALRAWKVLPGFAAKPVFAVNSLALAARLLLREEPARRDFALLADSRQGWWNTLVVRGGVVPEGFEERRGAELGALPEPRFRITQRVLSAPPEGCVAFPEGLLEREPAVFSEPGLLRETDAPDAVNIPGVFVKWTPARHPKAG